MPPMSSKKTALLGLPVAAVAGLAVRDVFQRKHSLLRAFPVIGHGRYAIEKLGPELRQYIIASNDAERPFSRDQRSYIYSSAKGLNTYFGFGTDNDVERVEDYRSSSTARSPLSRPGPRAPTATTRTGRCRAPRCWARRGAAGTRSDRSPSSTSPR